MMILIFSLGLIFTAGCTYHHGIRIMGSFSSSNKVMEAKFSKMSGEDIKEIKLDAGQNVVLDYQIHVEKGNLMIELQDPKGNKVVELETKETGQKEFTVMESGTYKLLVKGTEAKGDYRITWEIK